MAAIFSGGSASPRRYQLETELVAPWIRNEAYFGLTDGRLRALRRHRLLRLLLPVTRLPRRDVRRALRHPAPGPSGLPGRIPRRPAPPTGQQGRLVRLPRHGPPAHGNNGRPGLRAPDQPASRPKPV